MFITHIQYHTARTLAAALGHRWATLDATLAVACPTTPSNIRAACVVALLSEDDDHGPPGILAPRMDGDAIRHISASGSVRYVVHDDGSARIVLRDDAEAWYIARAYTEVAVACVALAAQGRRVELSRGRPTYRDDLAWGMPPDVVYMRAARHCLDTLMTEDDATEFFVAEVYTGSDFNAALAAFLECCRSSAAWSPVVPADTHVPCVETAARRTSTEADIPRRPEWTEE